jgi:hypothetical protein
MVKCIKLVILIVGELMRFLLDKVEIFGKSVDPINEVDEMNSRVYQCNLISRIGQKYLNTLVPQVPSKCDRFASSGRCGGQVSICYYDALMELVENKIAGG